ncbi:Ferric/cupric reductase transmembrane component 2 [Penicillium rolfsii]|nr:Ferric/cupric reductase transmembrane component 2 [Penicillium rolfsii]
MLFLIRIAPSFLNLLRILSFLITKHLTYPYLWGRHRLVAPCTRADALLYIVYAAANVFFIAFDAPSTTLARDRAGTLSVINMSFLFLAHHLGFLANAMGVSLMTCKRIHRAVGWMTSILLILHIIMALIVEQKGWSLREKPNLFAFIGAVMMAALLLLSFPVVRRFLYEPFLRLHQALAAACIYFVWHHLPFDTLLPRLYVYIPLGIMLLAFLVEVFLLIVRNGVFPSRPYSRASIRCDQVQQTLIQGKEMTPLKVRVALARPIHIQAGQYINLWIPAASLFSWVQTHPFMVTSWSPEKQDVLELFVQPRKGLTETIHHRTALDGYTSLTAFVTGPYGVSKSVDHYECVLAIATDFGIAGVISYLKKLLYGYNTCTSQVRRVHFVWEVQTLDIAVAAQPLLNSLLSDDVLDDGYILEMSFYVASNQMIEHGKPFGQHRRATVFNGKPRYDKIISEEASGRNIKRLANTHEARGEVLVINAYFLVSASYEVRDLSRELVRKHLEQKIRLYETEFQPS